MKRGEGWDSSCWTDLPWRWLKPINGSDSHLDMYSALNYLMLFIFAFRRHCIQCWIFWSALIFQVRLENSSIQISNANAKDGGACLICFCCFNDVLWFVSIASDPGNSFDFCLFENNEKNKLCTNWDIWKQRFEITWCSLNIIPWTHRNDVVYCMIGRWDVYVEHSWTLLAFDISCTGWARRLHMCQYYSIYL